MRKYEKHILALLEIEGFTKMYYKFCSTYKTDKEAYEATERLHVNYFNKRKYSDYSSFKNVRNRYLAYQNAKKKNTP